MRITISRIYEDIVPSIIPCRLNSVALLISAALLAAIPSIMHAEETTPPSEKVQPVAVPESESASNEEDPELARQKALEVEFRRGKLAYWFKDFKGAISIWQPLADDGYAPAQATIGWLYHNGEGVTQDYRKAIEWYRKASEQDYAVAQHNMGIMYENGWGVEQDFEQAANWYEAATSKKFGFAHFNLGMLYLNGTGRMQDRQKAIDLLKEAYRLYVDEAKTVLEGLGVKVQERDVPETKTKLKPLFHGQLKKDDEETAEPDGAGEQ